MPNVLVKKLDEQFLFENSEFQVTTDGVLSVHHSLPFKPHTVFAPGQWEAASNYEVEINKDVPGEDMFDEIADFMRAGHQQVPALALRAFTPERVQLYLDRVESELNETANGIAERDREEVVDGFLDIAYAAFTGALTVAGDQATREAWAAILKANTSKIDGTYGETVTDPVTGKILKPQGWKAPDIKGILERNS